MRPITLFTGQWADLPLNVLAEKAAKWGYDGLELACWGDHFDVHRALNETGYCEGVLSLLRSHRLKVWAISNHLTGQAVCDRIDGRHQAILPPRVWGDGDPDGVQLRAAEEMKQTARAASKLGVSVVNGFTGSSIWPLLYPFPPIPDGWINEGYADFARRWIPILDEFSRVGLRFALEVHPAEIAFDAASAARALAAIGGHPAFGFNYDPSHLAYQGVDYLDFLDRFEDRILHVHAKDVDWGRRPTLAGVFGGHTSFGDPRRAWDFRSIGRGRVDFEAIVRALNRIGYDGPLSVEWEDSGMDREHGAGEALRRLRDLDFPRSELPFDEAFGGA